MLTAEQIAAAKERVKYTLPVNHGHDDRIRVAYEWLDAQTKTKGSIKATLEVKHLIEDWAGGYVSRSDVEVAAFLHPEIKGQYPFFNISRRLTRPADRRLQGLQWERTQNHHERRLEQYARREDERPVSESQRQQP
jgi:hypothetical protein